MTINVFVKFDVIPSLPVQGKLRKKKRRGQKDGGTDNVKTEYPHKQSLPGYNKKDRKRFKCYILKKKKKHL